MCVYEKLSLPLAFEKLASAPVTGSLGRNVQVPFYIIFTYFNPLPLATSIIPFTGVS